MLTGSVIGKREGPSLQPNMRRLSTQLYAMKCGDVNLRVSSALRGIGDSTGVDDVSRLRWPESRQCRTTLSEIPGQKVFQPIETEAAVAQLNAQQNLGCAELIAKLERG